MRGDAVRRHAHRVLKASMRCTSRTSCSPCRSKAKQCKRKYSLDVNEYEERAERKQLSWACSTQGPSVRGMPSCLHAYEHTGLEARRKVQTHKKFFNTRVKDSVETYLAPKARDYLLRPSSPRGVKWSNRSWFWGLLV